MVKHLSDEKNNIQRKHSSLIADVNKFMDDTTKKLMRENYAKIMANTPTPEENL